MLRDEAPARSFEYTRDVNREALVRAISDPGYTPKRRDAKELLTLFDEKDESIAQLAERALLRVDRLDDAATSAFSAASPRARGRICRPLAKHGAAPRLATWLAGVLAEDTDAGVRKRAARALGHAADLGGDFPQTQSLGIAHHRDFESIRCLSRYADMHGAMPH